MVNYKRIIIKAKGILWSNKIVKFITKFFNLLLFLSYDKNIVLNADNKWSLNKKLIYYKILRNMMRQMEWFEN